MNALIRVDSHLTRIGQPKRPARRHPVLEEAAYQALAQLEFQGFDHPALRHVEREQNAGDDEEDAEFEQKVAQIAARQCIVEGLVPAIEANLAVGGGGHHENQGSHEHREGLAHRRAEDGPHDESDLPPKRRAGGLALRSNAGFFLCAFHHRRRGYHLARAAPYRSQKPAASESSDARTARSGLYRVVKMISAGPPGTVTDPSSTLVAGLPSTLTVRSGFPRGGRSTNLAVVPPSIAHRRVWASIRRSE